MMEPLWVIGVMASVVIVAILAATIRTLPPLSKRWLLVLAELPLLILLLALVLPPAKTGIEQVALGALLLLVALVALVVIRTP